MERSITFIGFGEAAATFADGMAVAGIRAYDRKTEGDATQRAKHDDFARLRVQGQDSNRAAVVESTLILSLVTADQALAAARETAASIAPGALFLDMNSVAPQTKRAAAALITGAGGRYVDAAIMAPVRPKARAVPVLLSGTDAEDAAAALAQAGFGAVRVVGTGVGSASSIKMIRSVMVKGIEALSAEMILAADAAGVTDEVIGSLNASWPGTDWADKADYALDRMMVHGMRRAAEMEEVAKTLEALGTGTQLTRGTIERQRAIGRLGIAPPGTLTAKIDAILGRRKDQAA